MQSIRYPKHEFRFKQEADKEWIFDEFRKQWVRLTPEEWVRQNMLQYLVQTLHYPATLIAVEKEISLGELKKRFDILVYRESTPWMIIECKEMGVPLSEAVLKQVLNYNISLRASYIIITNGSDTAGFDLRNGTAESITGFPSFS
ncbi:MAG: type I restriction enzyme HsdR N-terminal domain-containing protein [Chitinophagaceae bacterium]|nr:type I restriction enzyme HsdR N-terminal domain-containing protein [Chitinophagaceae bacterium]MCA6453131.1 type I restriction enzyme HsdR N-terminal domain-containing protein [Chitinophagaceae bacterium]MCA6455284.1 type I restriction enzyme HsdR N-terminal domain-containing protein [Chitinophagaceae bacterium]MCA6457827.1 type I restriction enzyme HsdR N-terminal domain-containing protein [Chitinophagaceae bacterium]MCA6463540.1 type I restriction enzyme HsdR N-terminal domain-containing 